MNQRLRVVFVTTLTAVISVLAVTPASSQTEPAVAISPDSGPPGTAVVVRGSGWDPTLSTPENPTGTLPYVCVAFLPSSQLPPFGAGGFCRDYGGIVVPINADGTWTATVSAKDLGGAFPQAGTVWAQYYLETASGASWGTRGVGPHFTVTTPPVVAPTLVILSPSSASGPRGTLVQWKVAGLPANATVTESVSTTGSGQAVGLSAATASNAGEVYGQYVVPCGAKPGDVLTFMAKTSSAGIAASADFLVAQGDINCTGAPAAQLEELTQLTRRLITAYNTVCANQRCSFAPLKLSDALKVIGRATRVISFANAARLSLIVGNDLDALNRALKGHTAGTPLTPRQQVLLNRLIDDTRGLHAELISLVPGLELVFPPLAG